MTVPVRAVSPHYQQSIRHGPLCTGLILLVSIPLVIFNIMKTSLDEEEMRYKLRDTLGGRPKVRTSGLYAPPSGGDKTFLWNTNRTLGKTILGETAFARCEVHSVLAEDGKHIIDDWLFMEERDAINVAVYTEAQEFLAFQQHKYAIPGETLAIVGGMIDTEKNESPFDAARREVWEELGVGSKQSQSRLTTWVVSMKDSRKENPFQEFQQTRTLDNHGLAMGNVAADESDWIFLGRYRTMANRGGGFLYSYLLKNAVPLVKDGGTENYRRTGDAEPQALVRLSKDRAEKAVQDGDFQEIKWAATMSLALTHLSIIGGSSSTTRRRTEP